MLSRQAQNSLNLYRGQNAESIKTALSFQRQSVVNELQEHFGCSYEDLPYRLSIGV